MSVLLSMTGYGESVSQNEQAYCRVEIRTVNNRHFKLTLRCPEGFQQQEAEFERLLRETISRGTVYLSVKIDLTAASSGPRINADLLKQYWHQLHQISRELATPTPDMTALLNVPGVLIDDRYSSEVIEAIWPLVEQGVKSAADHLQEFRRKEGEATAAELHRLCNDIHTTLQRVIEVAPQVAREYHQKLVERTRELLAGSDVKVEQSDVLREVALYADRCDIHEEISRLKSHISQFLSLVDKAPTPGRKLDFLCQEMFREANTIGSKANNVELSHSAVEMKSNIERIREIVQNVE